MNKWQRDTLMLSAGTAIGVIGMLPISWSSNETIAEPVSKDSQNHLVWTASESDMAAYKVSIADGQGPQQLFIDCEPFTIQSWELEQQAVQAAAAEKAAAEKAAAEKAAAEKAAAEKAAAEKAAAEKAAAEKAAAEKAAAEKAAAEKAAAEKAAAEKAAAEKAAAEKAAAEKAAAEKAAAEKAAAEKAAAEKAAAEKAAAEKAAAEKAAAEKAAAEKAAAEKAAAEKAAAEKAAAEKAAAEKAAAEKAAAEKAAAEKAAAEKAAAEKAAAEQAAAEQPETETVTVKTIREDGSAWYTTTVVKSSEIEEVKVEPQSEHEPIPVEPVVTETQDMPAPVAASAPLAPEPVAQAPVTSSSVYSDEAIEQRKENNRLMLAASFDYGRERIVVPNGNNPAGAGNPAWVNKKDVLSVDGSYTFNDGDTSVGLKAGLREFNAEGSDDYFHNPEFAAGDILVDLDHQIDDNWGFNIEAGRNVENFYDLSMANASDSGPVLLRPDEPIYFASGLYDTLGVKGEVRYDTEDHGRFTGSFEYMVDGSGIGKTVSTILPGDVKLKDAYRIGAKWEGTDENTQWIRDIERMDYAYAGASYTRANFGGSVNQQSFIIEPGRTELRPQYSNLTILQQSNVDGQIVFQDPNTQEPIFVDPEDAYETIPPVIGTRSADMAPMTDIGFYVGAGGPLGDYFRWAAHGEAHLYDNLYGIKDKNGSIISGYGRLAYRPGGYSEEMRYDSTPYSWEGVKDMFEFHADLGGYRDNVLTESTHATAAIGAEIDFTRQIGLDPEEGWKTSLETKYGKDYNFSRGEFERDSGYIGIKAGFSF